MGKHVEAQWHYTCQWAGLLMVKALACRHATAGTSADVLSIGPLNTNFLLFFPWVFQCVPIMPINTGSPLEHHWVLASASVVPVASLCTCGSHGLPVWSIQWYPSVLTESGLEVIRSGDFPACALQVFAGSPSGIQMYTGSTVAFQCHSSVHWTSHCTLAQSKGFHMIHCKP